MKVKINSLLFSRYYALEVHTSVEVTIHSAPPNYMGNVKPLAEKAPHPVWTWKGSENVCTAGSQTPVMKPNSKLLY
jgi:hypothetical protein